MQQVQGSNVSQSSNPARSVSGVSSHSYPMYYSSMSPANATAEQPQQEYNAEVDPKDQEIVLPVLASVEMDDDEEHSHSAYFRKDPSMDYQVNLHDDIISKHSIRQQRMGLDGIDNDNRYMPNPDYVFSSRPSSFVGLLLRYCICHGGRKTYAS